MMQQGPVDLAQAYPGAARAVACHEQHNIKRYWAIAMEAGWTPERTLSVMCETREEFGDTSGILDEMRHPDFLKYVRAKMGAV